MSEGKIPQIAMLVFLLSFFILPNSSLAKYSGGTGDVNDPYQIATVADLLALAADTNDYGKNFVLTADIDLDPNLPGRQVFTTAVIAPDSDNSNREFDGITFAGVFNGAGHKIINLTVDTNGAGNEYLGLFGFVAGEVKNLGIENVSIASGNESWCLGGLAGWNNGDISNCFSTGTVTAGDFSLYLGGLAGYNYCGTISNCFATGTVTGGEEPLFFGGLVGMNYYGTISDCFSTGTVSVSEYCGGLVGENDSGTISSSYFLDSEPNNGYGEPLTNEKMKQQSSFVGWDFVGETANGTEDIWRMCTDGIDYPRLNWQSIDGDFACPNGVNIEDLDYFVQRWLLANCTLSNNYCDGADINGSGVVDFVDFAIFAQHWLQQN